MCRNTSNVFPSIIYIGIMKTADQISEFLIFFFLFAEFLFKLCFNYFWFSHSSIIQAHSYIISCTSTCRRGNPCVLLMRNSETTTCFTTLHCISKNNQTQQHQQHLHTHTHHWSHIAPYYTYYKHSKHICIH